MTDNFASIISKAPFTSNSRLRTCDLSTENQPRLAMFCMVRHELWSYSVSIAVEKVFLNNKSPNQMEFSINVYYPIESTFINQNGKKGAIFDVINEEITDYIIKLTPNFSCENIWRDVERNDKFLSPFCVLRRV